MFFEPVGEGLVRGLLNERPHRGVAELALGLAFELWLLEANTDNGGETLPDVVALKVVLFLLQQVLTTRVLVDRCCESGAETLIVHTTFNGVDAIRETVDAIEVVAGAPLERDLDLISGFLA